MSASEWHDRAACSGTDDPVFFPSESESVAAERAGAQYCYGCPVYVQCLNSAIENGDVGIWAATSTDLRKKLRRKRNRKKCPGCQNERLSFWADAAACMSCGLSWMLEDEETDRVA